MRKLAIGVLAVVILLVAAVALVPSVIDWHLFDDQITKAVRDATGREIRIDGDIDIALIPAIMLTARDLHLANPSGFGNSDMASIDAIEGRVQLWPLLSRRVVVERLVIQGLDVALEVDADGRNNWSMEPQTSKPDEAESDEGLPIADLRLENVRLADGAFSFRNAVTGQELVGRDVNLALSLAALDAPLDVQGQWTLNEQPGTLVASIFPFDAVLADGPGRLAALLETTHLQARLDAGLHGAPEHGLDGQASVDVPSVGALAAWLDLPYESDPGPLRLWARFDGDGTTFRLPYATIEGDQLSVQASASVETDDDSTRFSAALRSGMVDIDRYLPPALSDRPASADTAAPEAESVAADGGDDDPLAMLPDTALDLDGLRQLTGDIDIGIEGITVAGYTAGPIRFTVTAQDGRIDADLDEIGLYDGAIGGRLRLDAEVDTLTADANLVVANVDVGALASIAAGDPLRVVGSASGRLLADTSGTTPKELVRNLVGELDASLVSSGGRNIAGQLSSLSLAFDRKSVDAHSHLRGSAVYGGERIGFDLKADRPILSLLLSEPIGVDFSVDSDVVTTSFLGRVVPGPATALDGDWQAAIPSVATFAAWLGQPLPEGQADPGGIQAYARLRSDGSVGAIEEATVHGEGLDLRATGNFDASGEVLRFDLAIDGGVLELDRYLPAGDADSADSAAAEGGAPSGAADPMAALSDEPIDLSPMRAQDGRVTVSLDGVRAAGLELGAIALEGTLEKGKLALVLEKLIIEDGTVTARLDADGSGDALAVDAALQMSDIKAAQLDALLSGSEITLDGLASGDVTLSSEGSSVRQLVTGATGTLQLDLPGASLGKGPIATVAAIDATLDMGGVDAGPRLDATTTLGPRGGGASVGADLEAQLGPVPQLLGGAAVPLNVLARIGKIKLEVTGQVAGLDRMPKPDLEIRIEADQLSDLDLLTGTKLADIGPVSVAAQVSAESDLYRIANLDSRLGRSDLGGEVSVQLGGDRPRVTADLSSELIDVNQLTGEQPAEQENVSGQESPSLTEQPASDDTQDESAARLIPDDPLPIDVLQALDAEIDLAIGKLTTHVGTDVDDLVARIEIADGNLRLTPVTGKSAGGDFALNLDLAGQGQTAEIDVDLQANQWHMGTFTKLIRSSTGSVGKLDADIQLRGAGGSPRAIASSLDGEVRLVGEGGAVDSTVMQVLSIGLGSLFDVFGDDKESTFLNCFVVRFDFENGIGSARAFLVDFPDISIVGTGTIDLTDEQLDLQFRPDSKNQSFVSLAVPFNVSGPLSSPSIRPDAAGSSVQALKGAGLAALFLNPITVLPAAAAAAALVGADMIQDAAGENPCVVALRNAEAVGEAAPEEGWFDKVFGSD